MKVLILLPIINNNQNGSYNLKYYGNNIELPYPT